MAQSETKTIKDIRYTAITLSVKQVRDILLQIEKEDYTPSLIDRLFVDGLPAPAFFASLGITEEQLDNLTPEEVGELMEAVAKANPTYAGMEKRMSANVANLEKLQRSLKEIVST